MIPYPSCTVNIFFELFSHIFSSVIPHVIKLFNFLEDLLSLSKGSFCVRSSYNKVSLRDGGPDNELCQGRKNSSVHVRAEEFFCASGPLQGASLDKTSCRAGRGIKQSERAALLR